jgi:predicted transcriptional regulator
MTTPSRPHRGGAGGFEPRAVVETRAQQAWELSAAGRSQREIAVELGITQPAVSKILRRVADALAAQRRDDDDRLRERLQAREDHLYREAIRGFERSQQEQARRRQRKVTDADGNLAHTVVEADVTTRDGDPRFLEQAGRALERTATLHGLTDGRTRSTGERDAGAARDRLASKLARFALNRGTAPPHKPE